MMTRELTGRHVFAIVVAAFAVIIAANMTMLFAATGSFPGLVVKNSYVAGQGWDARTKAQRDLGWEAHARYAQGELQLALTDRSGRPVLGAAPVLKIGRPTTETEVYSATAAADDQSYRVPIKLEAGRWRIDLSISKPNSFSSTIEIWVEESS